MSSNSPSPQPGPRTLLSKLLTTNPLPHSRSPPPSHPVVTNEEMAESGCGLCGFQAVCAINASKGLDVLDEDSILHMQNVEQTHFLWTAPAAIRIDKDIARRIKEAKKRDEVNVDVGPFCCANIKVDWRGSTLRDYDPEVVLIRKFLEAVREDRVELHLNELAERHLPQMNRVYKVNLYGPLGPLDPHSTWLYFNEMDQDDNGKDKFFGFMYCEVVQPFSSVKRYLAIKCKGDHKGCRRRHYRIGVYDAKRGIGSKGRWGTLGDQNLDKVLSMPAEPRIKLSQVTIANSLQALFQTAEEISENGI
ncbi:hypothetical protein EG329_001122 [Mollisiaceae sp. DMI_Dod_QoI]|nr:hypothetical protein EG329_001122 [Helotiales sp. DMI_Dod_QoI]